MSDYISWSSELADLIGVGTEYWLNEDGSVRAKFIDGNLAPGVKLNDEITIGVDHGNE